MHKDNILIEKKIIVENNCNNKAKSEIMCCRCSSCTNQVYNKHFL